MTTMTLPERHDHDDSREVLVKTPGNNSSLRLNAKFKKHDDLIVWEVTLPYEAPLRLIKQNSKWVSFGKSNVAISLIEAIGHAY